MVAPEGVTATKADLGGMRGAKGSNKDWKIWIRNVKLAVVPGTECKVVSGTYIELQTGATNHGGGTNGRISTPLLQLDDSVKPFGVRWLRLAETWLPAEELQALQSSMH